MKTGMVKKIFKVWMYVCTFLFSSYLIVVVGFIAWVSFKSDETIYITGSGEELDIRSMGNVDPEVLELFAAIESGDMEKIYHYAAPEIKEQISFESFVKNKWADVYTEDIEIIFTQSASSANNSNEHKQLILKFKENGSERLGTMLWEKSDGSIHYDTFPFRVSMLTEFGHFPSHVVD